MKSRGLGPNHSWVQVLENLKNPFSGFKLYFNQKFSTVKEFGFNIFSETNNKNQKIIPRGEQNENHTT